MVPWRRRRLGAWSPGSETRSCLAGSSGLGSPPADLQSPSVTYPLPQGAARLQQALEGKRALSAGLSCCLSYLVN